MGNNQNLSNQQLPAFENNFEHRHLGHIQNIQYQNYGQCFLKVYHFADQMMSHEKLRRYQARIKKYNNSDSVITVLGVQLKDKQQMCAHNSQLHLYLEKYTQTLRGVIESKLKERKNFTESQILEFLKMTVKTLIFLQDNGFKNSQLDKDSILLCGDKVKILDMAISVTSPYQIFLDQHKYQDGCYFSPQLLKDLKQKNFQPFLSPKSDVFSLGMLTLEMACQQPLDSYYDMEQFSIDYQSLIHRVSRIVYSTQLKTLIAGMLEYQGDLRLGLISLQQKINKILKVGSEGNDHNSMKRSRSSSTKMLKQLLTNSRRSGITSDKSTNSQTLIRKSSSTSLNSMASGSLISRTSLSKQLEKKKQIKIEKQVVLPTSEQTNLLRNMVKNKTTQQKQSPKNITVNISHNSLLTPSMNQYNTSSVNQYNTSSVNQYNTSSVNPYNSLSTNQYNVNKQNITSVTNSRNTYVENIMALHDIRRSSYNSKTFFDIPSYQRQENNAYTPRGQQPFFKKQKKQQESIFKLIETDPRYNSGFSQHISNHQNTTTYKQLESDRKGGNFHDFSKNPPTFSPLGLPKVQRVQQTNSISKPDPIQRQHQQVTDFGESKQFDNARVPPVSNEQIKKGSISLRVKNSLDNMYKTTRSISSSGQKSNPASGHKDLYKKIQLQNGFYYEGEVRNGDMFEGNGTLYTRDNQVVYSGSWCNGKYDGFGTLYNLHVSEESANKYNLAESAHNWIKYEGEFKKGEKQGFGTIYFVNGQKFSGCMKSGQINGYGCFYDNLNQMTSGIWACNKLQA